MRTTYIVCYDIANDKRLRKVFKTCGNFGDHLQFSVFECDLNPSEKIELETALSDIINHDEDQVIFDALGPALAFGHHQLFAQLVPQRAAVERLALGHVGLHVKEAADRTQQDEEAEEAQGRHVSRHQIEQAGIAHLLVVLLEDVFQVFETE